MVGTVLNNTYRLERALTKGGMGQVFVASHLRVSGRLYAIKQLHPELAVTPNFQTRFQREAEVMMTLEHPHIVRIEDFLIEGATYYLVMEFVEGDDLDKRLRRDKRLAPYEAHRLTLELLAGLDYCHNKGVVHRDLKPSNLLLDQHNTLKITDFGIALQESSEQRLTNTGTILGTPDYMSPEQIVGKPLDGRSDIYAVGTILYEMLVGQPLYPRTDEQQGSYIVLFSHVHKPPPPIVDPNIPEYLRIVIEQCLQKDPDNRYASAHDMALAMNDLAGDAWSGSADWGGWPHTTSPRISGGRPAFPAQAEAGGEGQGRSPGQPHSAIGTDTFHRTPGPLPSGNDLMSVSMPSMDTPPHLRAARSTSQPTTSRKGLWGLLFVFLLLAGGTGVYVWPEGREIVFSWYKQLTGEVDPGGNKTRVTPPPRRGQNPDTRTVPHHATGPGPDAAVTADAGVAGTLPERTPSEKIAPTPEHPSETTGPTPDSLPQPTPRTGTLGRQPPPGDQQEPSPSPDGDVPSYQEPSQARWPLPVSKQCANLLAICVRHCLKSKDSPTLSFAMACRQRCWKMRRLFKIKGQSICPSYDRDDP